MKISTRRISLSAQSGLTLIEFMISVVIGMLMVAALATLIANQSTNRAEVDRTGKMIENGRYAVQTVMADAQLAGYWGEYYQSPGSGGAMDPCNAATLQADTLEHVQGYEDTAGAFPSCISNHKSGTDVFVIRRAEPDSSDVETGGNLDWTKLTAGQYYLQTGLDSTGQMKYVMAQASATQSTNQSTFTLLKKDKATAATLRKMLVHIYYVSDCSVEVAGSCTGADGGTPIPTLKRVDMTTASGTVTFTKTTIAEGIENMQVDYGLDADADGTPDSYVGAASILTAAGWANVMTVRVYMLGRATEVTPGYTDTKSYVMGTYGTASAPSGAQGYKRHIFTQTQKLVNPSGRLTS